MTCKLCDGSGGVQGIPCPECDPIEVGSKPRVLRTAKRESSDNLIETLERLLTRAQAGEIESLLWFTEDKAKDDIYWGTAGWVEITKIIGRLEVLKAELVAELLADR